MVPAYSTLDKKIRITHEKQVTVEFVVKEADAIWKEARAFGVKFGDEEGAKKVLQETQRMHPEFCKSYPIVHRYICQMHEYCSKTFMLWLRKIERKPWRTEAEYLDAQADYVAMLFKAKNRRAGATAVSNLRKNIRNMLQKEHDYFKENVQRIEKEVKAEEAEFAIKNTEELYEFAKVAGVSGLSEAGTIRVESDLAPLGKITIDAAALPRPVNSGLITASELLDL